MVLAVAGFGQGSTRTVRVPHRFSVGAPRNSIFFSAQSLNFNLNFKLWNFSVLARCGTELTRAGTDRPWFRLFSKNRVQFYKADLSSTIVWVAPNGIGNRNVPFELDVPADILSKKPEDWSSLKIVFHTFLGKIYKSIDTQQKLLGG